MLRQLVVSLMMLAGLAAISETVIAQTVVAPSRTTKAYAPDNLQQLSVPDRIRVIEKEYAEQSDGSAIPDDQLEFYLDQIQSGWTFSRIKTDIATSLGGEDNDGDWDPPGSGWNQQSLICSSEDRRYEECRTPFRGRARIIQQISETRCIENNTWGQRQGLVWVTRGCRARFGEDPDNEWSNDGNWGNGQRITCESREGRYRECRTNFRGKARIHRQLSSNSCTMGRDWGSRPGLIWVKNGCRAEFVDSYGTGNSNYSVTCVSDDGQYRTCAWDRRHGQPRLIEQLSNRACIQSRSWGYDSNRGLWVDDGCRARFGTR